MLQGPHAQLFLCSEEASWDETPQIWSEKAKLCRSHLHGWASSCPASSPKERTAQDWSTARLRGAFLTKGAMAEGPRNPAGSSGSCCWESSAAGRGRWPTPLALVAVMKRLRSAFKCSRAGRAQSGRARTASPGQPGGGLPSPQAPRWQEGRPAAPRGSAAPPLRHAEPGRARRGAPGRGSRAGSGREPARPSASARALPPPCTRIGARARPMSAEAAWPHYKRLPRRRQALSRAVGWEPRFLSARKVRHVRWVRGRETAPRAAPARRPAFSPVAPRREPDESCFVPCAPAGRCGARDPVRGVHFVGMGRGASGCGDPRLRAVTPRWALLPAGLRLCAESRGEAVVCEQRRYGAPFLAAQSSSTFLISWRRRR